MKTEVKFLSFNLNQYSDAQITQILQEFYDDRWQVNIFNSFQFQAQFVLERTVNDAG